jgi:hypothetical protein
MMVAGAKADLLRREDYNNLIHHRDVSNLSPSQGFPGGWGSPIIARGQDKEDGALANFSSLAQALPKRDRTGSLGSVSSVRSLKQSQVPEHGVYQPPTPSYAISASDPIPPGYVAHARDACVNVDYQWDSMREPQNWPNGGEYGEEWSSMHKRFRKGLQQMVHWYEGKDGLGENSNNLTVQTATNTDTPQDDDDDDETDLVLILVTHGAGCNALIGALTNQPVLLSVGMASLTMAVRKPSPKSTPIASPANTPKQHSRVSSKILGVSDDYDVKLVANTEHLRPSTATTPSISRANSISTPGAPMSTYRHRYGTSGEGVSVGEPTRSITANANIGSIRRTVSSTPAYKPSFTAIPSGSMGLWSANRSQSPGIDEREEEPGDDMVLNFGGDAAYETPPAIEEIKKDAVANVIDKIDEIKERDDVDVVAPLGLWGAPRPPGDAERLREAGNKRRWTTTERA